MITTVSQPDDVWFVDSGASNYMTSHQEWFMNLREPERPGVVETSDDSTHTIEHIGDVALNNHDSKGYMKDVLHVSTITKNLVSVGQIVEQGCKYDSTKKVASLRIRANLSLMQEEKVACLFLMQLR